MNLRHDCLISQVVPPGQGGHPALLQQGGQGHGHAVHVEHGQEGEDIHARGCASKLWVASLGEVGHNVPMGETHLGFWGQTNIVSYFEDDCQPLLGDQLYHLRKA